MTRVLFAATPVVFCLLLAGCDSSTEEGGKQSVSLEDRLERAQQAMKDAVKAGADKIDPADFEAQKKKIEEAQALMEEGKKPKLAQTKLSQAERTFKEMVRKSEDLKQARTTLEEALKKAQGQIAAARKQGYDVGAPEIWSEIKKITEAAQTASKSSSTPLMRDAGGSLQSIAELIESAKTRSQDQKVWKEKAEGEKKAALEAEGVAREARAEKEAPEDLARGAQHFREAEVDLKNANYHPAYDNFRAATLAYNDAANRARAMASLGEGGTPPPQKVDRVPELSAAPPTPLPSDTPEVGVVPEPEGSELSPEDEIFFQENFKKICTRVEAAFDPSSGEVTVDYPFGDQLKPDLIFPFGMDNKYIEYRDPMLKIDSKKAEGKRDVGLSFGGNTKGFFLMPMPFKDKVVMEFEVGIGIMKSEGTLSAILMASEDGKSYIAANFGTVEVYQGGRKVAQKPPNDPKLRRSPNMWFRKEPLMMKVIYEAKDEKKAQVSIWYDTDDVEREHPINVATVPARNGITGFSWFVTKFNVRLLKITGKLDKKAAVALLRKKLGQETPKTPKTGTGSKTPGEEGVAEGGPREKAVPPAGAKKSKKPADAESDDY